MRASCVPPRDLSRVVLDLLPTRADAFADAAARCGRRLVTVELPGLARALGHPELGPSAVGALAAAYESAHGVGEGEEVPACAFGPGGSA